MIFSFKNLSYLKPHYFPELLFLHIPLTMTPFITVTSTTTTTSLLLPDTLHVHQFIKPSSITTINDAPRLTLSTTSSPINLYYHRPIPTINGSSLDILIYHRRHHMKSSLPPQPLPLYTIHHYWNYLDPSSVTTLIITIVVSLYHPPPSPSSYIVVPLPEIFHHNYYQHLVAALKLPWWRVEGGGSDNDNGSSREYDNYSHE